MSTPTVRPTVVTRRGSGAWAACVGASRPGTSDTIVSRVAVAGVAGSGVTAAGAKQSHHFCHLSEESSFASGKRRFTLLERGVRNKITGRESDAGHVGLLSGDGFEKVLGN